VIEAVSVPSDAVAEVPAAAAARRSLALARKQGLTLLHFSAQRKRILWDRGCA